MEVTAADCDGPDPNDDIPGPGSAGITSCTRSGSPGAKNSAARAAMPIRWITILYVHPLFERASGAGRPGPKTPIDCYIDTVTVYEGP